MDINLFILRTIINLEVEGEARDWDPQYHQCEWKRFITKLSQLLSYNGIDFLTLYGGLWNVIEWLIYSLKIDCVNL